MKRKHSMTLSKKEILEACKKNNLIQPYSKDLVQTCSYDLTFSGEYRIYDPKKNHQQNKKLKAGANLVIPADAICFVLTNETVNIPDNLTASISLSMGLIKSGVMLAAQPPYDAGYSGKTVALLHNLSSEPVCIEVGQHILNIAFNELKSKVPANDRYKGKYQNASSLNDFRIKALKGGVFELAEDFRKQKKKFEQAIPNLLTIITVILGVLTILMTISSPIDAITKLFSSGNETDKSSETYDSNEVVFTVPTSEEVDEVIIYVNGKAYIINFEEESITEHESDSTGDMNEE